jgi:hypothetical protein
MQSRDRAAGRPQLGSLAKENAVRAARRQEFGVVALAGKATGNANALGLDKQNAISRQRFNLHEMACNIGLPQWAGAYGFITGVAACIQP